MIKAIIFDCFGVVFIDKFDVIYNHFGGDLEADKDFIEQHFFDVSKGVVSSNNSILEDRVGVSVAEWENKRKELEGFNTDLLEYIKVLRNKYIIAMLSNIGNNGLESYMDYGVLEEHFDLIVESAKIGFAKPEARAYETVADKLGVRLDECVFIDDRQPYIEGAQHVGMKTILYEDFKKFKKDLEVVLG